LVLTHTVGFLATRELPRPAAVLAATAAYRAESDIIANWLDAGQAIEIPGCRTTYRDIADSFRSWYRKEGYAVGDLPNDRKLASLLSGHGFKKARVKGTVYYDGVRIEGGLAQFLVSEPDEGRPSLEEAAAAFS
jgi:hypothetical protein